MEKNVSNRMICSEELHNRESEHAKLHRRLGEKRRRELRAAALRRLPSEELAQKGGE